MRRFREVVVGKKVDAQYSKRQSDGILKGQPQSALEESAMHAIGRNGLGASNI